LPYAGSTYDIVVGDINPMIRFNAEKPEIELIAVAVLYDASPLWCDATSKRQFHDCTAKWKYRHPHPL
jgi:hypothetical protein